jgi:2-dehydropantoate 2-reductase
LRPISRGGGDRIRAGGEGMVVTVVGCGALGSLIAARLIEGGLKVQVLQRPGAQLEALRRSGITIEADRTGTTRNFRPAAVSDDPAALAPSRLAIVLVKAYSTGEVHPVRAVLAQDGVVLTLQNGLGNAEVLAALFSDARVAAGVATYGAYQLAPGVIHWGGDGFITLGPWQPGAEMSWIGDLMAGAGLRVTYVEDPRPAIWRKLFINAMVNTTAALTGMGNGELLANPMALEMMKRLGREAVMAAGRAGVVLDFDEMWAMHLDNLERTAANRPSMLQDLEAGRQTEIDAISGGVLQHARDDGEFPYTRSVYTLLKAIDLQRGY